MKKRILSLLLALLMVLEMIPVHVGAEDANENCPYCEAVVEDGTLIHAEYCTAEYVYDGTADVGKYVELIESVGYCEISDGTNYSESMGFFYDEFTEGTIMRITDWYWDAETTGLWYAISFYSGGVIDSVMEFWPETPWVLYDYTDTTYEYDAALMFVDVCDVCGEPNCTKSHTWCGICGKYDCGLEHGEPEKPSEPIRPNTEPVIPEVPVLTEGQDVSLVDGSGNPITESGLAVSAGSQVSMSAWTELEGDLSYQWQIRYDSEENLWADIQGQTGKGMLASPAMFLSILNEEGSAAIRCVVTNGEFTQTSMEIPVTVAVATNVSSDISGTVADAGAVTAEEGDGELQKVNLIVEYKFADNRIAANPWTAELPVGKERIDTIKLPVVPGYLPTFAETENAEIVTEGDVHYLVINYPDGITEDTTLTVTYQATSVNVTVHHYWQNVNDDGYTLKETENISLVTDSNVGNVHKNYTGFYNLLYEKPDVAADGSTVVEVYYDRYYYLMKFELGDRGYGVEPVYARYEDDVTVGTPTRAGYTFLGWELDGNEATVPAKMPAENRTYVARWKMADSAKVNVVIWGENPDDEGYSYQKTIEIYVKPGETGDIKTLPCCGLAEHAHVDSCEKTFVCTEQVHEHTVSCYNNVNTTNMPSNSDLNGAPQNPVDGQIYRRNSYYNRLIFISGTWYLYNGYTSSGNIVQPNRSCPGVHIHNDACYSYSCGLTQHSHGNACYNTLNLLDANLWTYITSDTVTVEPDGSTVLNVYYDRITFTLTFIRSNNTVKTITEKWGADIHSQFPIKNGNNTMWWTVPNDCSSLKPGTGFGSLDTMPAENITFKYESETQAATLHYYIEALPDEDGKTAVEIYNGFTSSNYSGIDGTKRFKSYKDINVTTNGYLTYTEEFHNIIGFRQYVSYPKFNKHEQGGKTNDIKKDNYLLYVRNAFDIVFYNPSELIKTQENVPYQMPLDSYEWAPTAEDAPDIYEPGSVQFAGWYLNPEGTGEKFDFTTHTMPAGPNNVNGETALALYAKWEPIEHQVRYFLTYDSFERGEDIPAEMDRLVKEAVAEGTAHPGTDPYSDVFKKRIVMHGSYIGAVADPKVSEGYENIHPRANYEFIGWFYMENGEERAFDPVNMPVTKNLNLYAKWSSNELRAYTVFFALDADKNGVADTDVDGNIIYVADPITGSTLAGNSKTFAAKGDTALYPGYQTGYYPNSASHTINASIEDADNEGANTFTFLYTPAEKVPYTVKYLIKDTNEPVPGTETKNVADNNKAVVTENFVPVSGYMPDAYQKTLVVTPDGENEITFWYTEDKEHSLYQVNHYIQNLDGSTWTLHQSETITGDIGNVYFASPIPVTGFAFSEKKTNDYNVTQKINGYTKEELPAAVIAYSNGVVSSATKLTSDGLQLNLYYTREAYPYQIYFLEYGTNEILMKTIEEEAPYGTLISHTAKSVISATDEGVEFELYDTEPETKTMTIRVDKLQNDTVSYNVIRFYYKRCTQDLTVKKEVAGKGADLNREFEFQVILNPKYTFHQVSYAIGDGNYLAPDGNTLTFNLKAGESITLEDLPTAEYTIREVNVPENYEADIDPTTKGNQESVEILLQKDTPVEVTCTNTYKSPFGSLTIKKTVDGSPYETETFIFHISGNGVDMDVTIKGSDFVTIHNLPLGKYTVTEDTSWSWRYETQEATRNVEISQNQLNAEVAFENEFVNNKWLNSFVNKLNKFLAQKGEDE